MKNDTKTKNWRKSKPTFISIKKIHYFNIHLCTRFQSYSFPRLFFSFSRKMRGKILKITYKSFRFYHLVSVYSWWLRLINLLSLLNYLKNLVRQYSSIHTIFNFPFPGNFPQAQFLVPSSYLSQKKVYAQEFLKTKLNRRILIFRGGFD